MREALGLGRAEFAKLCGVSRPTLKNTELGIQRPTEELIVAIGENWPQFAYWLVTGKEIPEAGQISPETEQIRRELPKAVGE